MDDTYIHLQLPVLQIGGGNKKKGTGTYVWLVENFPHHVLLTLRKRGKLADAVEVLSVDSDDSIAFSQAKIVEIGVGAHPSDDQVWVRHAHFESVVGHINLAGELAAHTRTHRAAPKKKHNKQSQHH